MRGVIAFFVRAALLAELVLALTGAAYGHAVLLETAPSDGAVLTRALDRIIFRFNEPVSLISVQVLDGAGRAIVPPGAAETQDREILVALPGNLPAGTYVASYRVMSIDSHPIGGSIVFSIGAPSGRPPSPAAASDDAGWRLAMLAINVVLYAGILGGAGGVLFLLLLGPDHALGRAVALSTAKLACLGSVAAFFAVGIQGASLLGGELDTLFTYAAWRTGFLSTYGRTAVTAMLGLALVALGLCWRQSAIARALAYGGAAAALASFAQSGHVVTAGPIWLTSPVLILHTAAVAFWVGALIPLRQALGLLGNDAAPIVTRFSRMALWTVPVLILAGLVIAILQVSTLGGLFTTTYGWLLLAKLGAVTALLAGAALNKLRLTPSLAAGDPRAVGGLQRSISAEIGLALCILVATAALGTTPPPRVLAQTGYPRPAPEHDAHGHRYAGIAAMAESTAGRAEIRFASAESGQSSVELTLTDPSGAPLKAREVTFVAVNPMAGVEAIKRTAEPNGAGGWRVDGLWLVPAGEWSIRVEALVGDFEMATFETSITLQ